jgi:two-component system sensor histidine kinase TctE
MWLRGVPTDSQGSLLRRLILVVFATLTLFALVLVGFLDAFASHASSSAYDRLLSASALSIADSVRSEDDGVDVDLPYSSLGILATARRDRVFYKLLRADGTFLTGYEDLPGGPSTSATEHFGDGVYLGFPIRYVRVGRLIGHAPNGEWITIVVAQTREERNGLASRIFTYAFAPLAPALLFGAGMVFFGIRKTLAPLRALETVIRSRGPNDFQPIGLPLPMEVRPLLDAVNTLMARLESNLESSRIFLADAAHEIRTPLASLRAQAELAIDETDPGRRDAMIRRIHRNAVDASDLTTQLLSHAAIVHRSEAIEIEPTDLGRLAQKVIERATAIAEEVDVGLEIVGGDAVVVDGDPIILREALANLLGNAIRYAGGAGPIDLIVRAEGDGHGVVMEVVDHGPGIGDDEKPEVLKRFTRGRQAAGTTGSGLGLVIVAAAAEAHHATLELADTPGGGLTVRLAFPSRPEPDSGPEATVGSRPSGLRRLAAGLVALLVSCSARADEPIVYPTRDVSTSVLRIASATDRRLMEPLILDFQTHYPTVVVEYTDVLSADLHALVATGSAETMPDLVISPAIDLQVKLVNDGHTRPHVSAETTRLPSWAIWRDELFCFSEEPAVIVTNRDLVPEVMVPHTRDALIRLLSEWPERFQGRVATYDASQSGVGYLMASQDSLLTSRYWQLMAAFGNRRVVLEDRTADILDAIQAGDLLIGYNVLGTYARERRDAGAPIRIVLPTDYTLVVPRSAIIPKQAHQPDLAGRFIDYLLSPDGRARITATMGNPTASGEAGEAGGLAETARGESVGAVPLHRMAVGPGLLVFLDQRKRQRFLGNWLEVVRPMR